MQNKRKIIESYHKAWIKRDLRETLSFLMPDLYLKSPIDEFSGLDLFEQRCWPLGEALKGFIIRDFMESEDKAFFTYDAIAGVGNFRCAEVFTFAGSKISAIDIYWGTIPKASGEST